MLEQFPQVYGIMRGEGEETFLELAEFYYNNSGKSLEQCEKVQRLKEIVGITFRDGEEIIETADRSVMDLSKVPFVYEDLDVFKNKIIYYESSRGCPFSCSYCLSSIDKCLRFRDLELDKKELRFYRS